MIIFQECNHLLHVVSTNELPQYVADFGVKIKFGQWPSHSTGFWSRGNLTNIIISSFPSIFYHDTIPSKSLALQAELQNGCQKQ